MPKHKRKDIQQPDSEMGDIEQSRKRFEKLNAAGMNLEIKVPENIEVLVPRGFGDKPTIENPVAELQRGLKEKVFEEFKRQNGRYPESVLMVISDDTRPVNTPRVAIEALLNILEKMKNSGNLPDKVTILTGTGTHKLMQEDDKRQDFSKFLGKELWERLLSRARDLHIQFDERVIDGHDYSRYPIIQHWWKDPSSLIELDATMLGKKIQINNQLFQHEACIIAADVDLHPYMGASGGIYKFCIIGLGGPNNIFVTHSPDALLDSTTGPGRAEGNKFFGLVREMGLNVVNVQKTQGQLKMDPVSANLIMDHYNKRVVDVIVDTIGVGWEQGVSEVFPAYRGDVTREADIVIGGVDSGKDQELAQGARLIDYVMRVNDHERNPVLTGNSDHRVAVLFNPCVFSEGYMGGIATAATYAHLIKLKDIATERASGIRDDLSRVQSVQDALDVIKDAKTGVLEEWEKYLYDEYIAKQGFGEGGQRTLRVLNMLRNFNEILIGTNNRIPDEYVDRDMKIPQEYSDQIRGTDRRYRSVVEFVGLLSPDLTEHLSLEVKKQLPQGVALTLLGIRAFQVDGPNKDEMASQIVHIAIDRHKLITGGHEPNVLLIPDMHTLPQRI